MGLRCMRTPTSRDELEQISMKLTPTADSNSIADVKADAITRIDDLLVRLGFDFKYEDIRSEPAFASIPLPEYAGEVDRFVNRVSTLCLHTKGGCMAL